MAARAEIRQDEHDQFVELPPGLEFPDDVTDVEITIVGRARMMAPVEGSLKQQDPAEPEAPKA